MDQILGRIEALFRVVLIIDLAFMSILICYQVFMRYVVGSPSSASEEMLRYSMVWLGILGAALCFIKGKHLNLPLLLDKATPLNYAKIRLFTVFINTLIGIIMLYGGVLGLDDISKTPILGINNGLLQSVVIITGATIIVSQIAHAINLTKDNKGTFIYLCFIVLSLTGLFFGYLQFKNTEWFESIVYDNIELSSFIVLCVSFIILLVMGTPIAVGLAISGLLTLSLQLDVSDLASTSGGKLFNSLNNFGFLALPFFILAGNIMNQGGIARRLINLAMLAGRKIPGSLWQTNVVANMMFGSLSGSAIAAATAIGGIISPMAKEKNYDMPMTTAVNASSSICGMSIPPTGVFIVYSLITGGSASIAALFLAGYVPGLILGLSVMLVALHFAIKNNYQVSTEKVERKEYLSVAWGAAPSLGLIFVVIGGIIGGIFTAIEASGIAVLYSLVLSIFYRSMTWEKLKSVLYESAQSSAVILFLIACSSLMSWSMTFAYIPDVVAEFLISVSDNKYVILLLINITLLFVGIFMDMSPALLIFTPILYPIVTQLGVDPVHFGVIMVYNLSMGVVTPPVGTVLFVSCSISDQKITKVIKPLLPIFFVQFIGLLLITYIPELSLWLPRIFGLM